MTGSPLIPIVAPVVMLICLGFWIALVFYADAHPRWARHHAQVDPVRRIPAAPSSETSSHSPEPIDRAA